MANINGILEAEMKKTLTAVVDSGNVVSREDGLG